uniref:AFP-like domain-containing protein n=1 Tax=Chromera velia CCMP2878 TaxID=1169474 RepID=A0A0G4FHV1_9ALVE|eukprot:Cvel_3341.t1-p1 / transcript=Cvel_3341.t1 / gene=Cvel_3341 / organism=Chromera_velia_CCMP2878 / gene_product=Uncharacterized protein MJ1065, putative / transcript_product=Uncharacterized protein MJ1065, putative / location=Cvel_scaffold133:42267-46172(+) / protein_length=571 / sequence_SO=supercontig / SO=protein_coding / is_pseudo=false
MIAVILARGGSKRFPGKNVTLLCGKPLIAWTIEAALGSGLFSQVVVSTDCEKIKAVAERYGASVPFLRPADLASDDARAVDALEHCLQTLGVSSGKCCLLQPTSPVRSAEDVRRAAEEFEKCPKDVVLVSVIPSSSSPFKTHTVTTDNLMAPVTSAQFFSTNAQSHPPTYSENGAIYFFHADSFFAAKPQTACGVYGYKAAPFVMSPETSVDIDKPEDLERAVKALAPRLRQARPPFLIGNRVIGPDQPPLVIAEIGINHEGDFQKAIKMVDDAHAAGCEIAKFQCHVCSDEMTKDAGQSISEKKARCALTEEEDRKLKEYVEAKGMIYMSTPFSRAAAERLKKMNVDCYKIGSGECNNYPLISHIAKLGKPVILSTGMNDIASVAPGVEIFRKHRTPFALLHCTSMYPTPYEQVRLGGIAELERAFPDAVLGLSDHSLGIWTCLAAVPLGACILEKHFTSDKTWPGPDVPISIDPDELRDLIQGSNIIFRSLGGTKEILKEEQPTIDFAYACVVTIKPIAKGEVFSMENVWVKRPGTGEIFAKDFEVVLGKMCMAALETDMQLKWADVQK